MCEREKECVCVCVTATAPTHAQESPIYTPKSPVSSPKSPAFCHTHAPHLEELPGALVPLLQGLVWAWEVAATVLAWLAAMAL